MNPKTTLISFAFQIISPSLGQSRVDDTGKGRRGSSENECSSSVYEPLCPAAMADPCWPTEILPIVPPSCPAVLVTEMSECSGS